MKYEILDKSRMAILPMLSKFKTDFYLAGGTGLALHFGHRDSIDFDFFSTKDIATDKLYQKIKDVFVGYKIKKIQEEKNTLTVILNGKIKLSFFSYPYKLIGKVMADKYLRVASVLDISCMKLSAIVSRATNKDYLDLYFILQKYKLPQLLTAVRKKFPDLDVNLVLKSLVYFKDVSKETIKFKTTKVTWTEVKEFLEKEIYNANPRIYANTPKNIAKDANRE